jgi:hypothetical protein
MPVVESLWNMKLYWKRTMCKMFWSYQPMSSDSREPDWDGCVAGLGCGGGVRRVSGVIELANG